MMPTTNVKSEQMISMFESLNESDQIYFFQLMTEATRENHSQLNQLLIAGKKFLESYEPDEGLLSAPVGGGVMSNSVIDSKLIEEVNSIFTPILAMQQLNSGVMDRINEACSSDNVLTENNIIKFDDNTKKAQLVSLCSLLLARNANSPDYAAYKQASQVKKSLRLKMQQEYNAAACALADKYLQHIKTTSNSPDIRAAAEELSNAGSVD